MIDKFGIENLRFYAGAQAGLAQSTAIVHVRARGFVTDFSTLRRVIAVASGEIAANEPFHDVDWNQGPWALAAGGSVDGLIKDADGVSNERLELGAWIVALCILMQRVARDAVGRGYVIDAHPEGWCLAIPYQRADVCKDALGKALQFLILCQQKALDVPGYAERWRHMSRERAIWQTTAQAGGMDPLSQRFALAALAKKIPMVRAGGLVRLGQGINSIRFLGSFTDRCSAVAANLARDKVATQRVLSSQAIPVPNAEVVSAWDVARTVPQRLGWPLVVKPSNQDMGIGVTAGIRDEARLERAFHVEAKLSPGSILIEQHVRGSDHRLLIVNGEMLIATRRIPGAVVGDGHHTIRELLAQLNADPRRGTHKRSLLIKIELDEEALDCLNEANLTADDVPADERPVVLRRTANIATGGTAEDVTSRVHPDNRLVCERAARAIGLDIAGVDFICPDISRSWKEVGGAVLEVNAQPGFRPHWLGDPRRELHGEIIQRLFSGRPYRIPTAAITGSNGKTTVTRMLHHLWREAGCLVGRCETDGVWIGDACLTNQNLSGYSGARMLLDNPGVEAAILEMPRKGLIAIGHPSDAYDVAALLNVANDPADISRVPSVDVMAQQEMQLLRRARLAVVLNIDDPVCRDLARRASDLSEKSRDDEMLGWLNEPHLKKIWVSREIDSTVIQEHLASGGQAVTVGEFVGERWMVLADGAERNCVIKLADMPSTHQGTIVCNESNALSAVAIAWAQGLSLDVIRTGLSGFGSSSAHNPGRYHFEKCDGIDVVFDFAQNPQGVSALCDVVKKIPVSGRRRLLAFNIGNRHRSHIDSLTSLLLESFDDWIIGCDPQVVKRSAEWSDPLDPMNEVNPDRMLRYFERALLRAGADPGCVRVEKNQQSAVDWGMRTSLAGDLLVVLVNPDIALRLQRNHPMDFPAREKLVH